MPVDAPPGAAHERPGALSAIFGLIVWALHFLSVYVIAALFCMGWGRDVLSSTAVLRAVLLGFTAIAMGAIAMHALHHRGSTPSNPDAALALNLTLGNDALALFAIALMIVPILMAAPCG